MLGDSSDKVWGVMDIYPRTNFEDIRKKGVIHSAAGSAVLIPREGDYMVRFYIEQPAGTAAAEVTLEGLEERLRLILAPYDIDIVETAWWSAYSIGQRIAESFHQHHRVFLTGDACHTHSPKAGQGMNVSLQDGYNLGWKLGTVLAGKLGPKESQALLETYVSERQQTAADLIAFDRELTKLFSSQYRAEKGISAEHFATKFAESGRYTAGQATRYGPSLLIRPDEASRRVPGSLTVGMRFPSAQVVRFSDAKAMQLLRALKADGKWRIVVFAGDIQDAAVRARLDKAALRLEASVGDDVELLLVLKSRRTEVLASAMPAVFMPTTTNKWGIRSELKKAAHFPVSLYT
jgi:phenol 2-monooxygenase (NADPH)